MPEARTIVIRLTPKRTTLLVGLALLWVSILVGAFYLGFVWAVDADERLRRKNSQLVSQSNQQAIKLRVLSQRVVHAEKTAEIDRMAAETVRQELLGYRKKVASLHKDLAFYRSLMAPDELAKGFTVHQFDVNFDALTNTYSYKGIVTNAGGAGNVISGALSILLTAQKGNETVEQLLSELPDFSEEMPIKLRFRFFQNIEGEFKLPSDYEPVSMVLSARLKASSKPPQRSVYDWAKLTQHIRPQR